MKATPGDEVRKATAHGDAMKPWRAYAKRGMKVFPVYSITGGGQCTCGNPACKKPGKHPRILAWENAASNDLSVIAQWVRRWPDANIGWALGRDGYGAIDVDFGNGGADSLACLEQRLGSLDTSRQISGSGGEHHIVAVPQGIALQSRSQAFGSEYPGVDFKTSGGYIILPPSRHYSGGVYTWDAGSPSVQELPQAWVGALVAAQNGKAGDGRPIGGIDDGVPLEKGARHTEMIRYAGRCARTGMDEAQVLQAVTVWGETYCNPPYTKAEVETELRLAADSAVRKYGKHADEAAECYSTAALLITCASDVRAKRTEWFEPERIPFGGVTLFDGPGGVGKTTANLGIIAAASVGRSFFDGSPREPITSIVVAEEDSLGHLKLKLRLAGADLSRIHFVTGVRVADGVEPFALPIHVAGLEQTIETTGARFVYVDALFSHLLLEGDGRTPQQVRRALRPLVEMVARTGVAFAATRHWTKAAGPASARALGSAELGNIARSVLSFARHPDDESRGVIAVTKHNLARGAPTLAYRIEALMMDDDDGSPCEVTKVTLDGEAPDVTADDIAMQLPGDPDERGAAQDWLADFLGDGEWHGATEVYKAARKDGAGAPATVRRAATRLGIERDRSGFPSRSRWRLRTDCSQFAHSQSMSELEQIAQRNEQTAAAVAAEPVCAFFIGNSSDPCGRCGASFAEHHATRP